MQESLTGTSTKLPKVPLGSGQCGPALTVLAKSTVAGPGQEDKTGPLVGVAEVRREMRQRLRQCLPPTCFHKEGQCCPLVVHSGRLGESIVSVQTDTRLSSAAWPPWCDV